ncbi:hypothetical protein COOONC_15723 [Cooperia oncophora]
MLAIAPSFRYLFAENGTYGGVTVNVEKGDESEGFVVREFAINKTKLKAYCIMGWNADAEPPRGFLAIHDKIRSAIGTECKNPVMLICKDGCSRSGLFCLLDIEAERVHSKGRIKFAESVKHIRYDAFRFELYRVRVVAIKGTAPRKGVVEM